MPTWFRHLPLLAAFLALLSQLAFATPPAAASRETAATIHICGVPSEHQAPHHQHLPCHLCPLCFATTHSAPLLPPAPTAAPPSQLAIRAYRTPFQPRAPPAHAFTAAYPRGPPALA